MTETKNIDAIYLHIPFCDKKCEYCDFCTFVKMEREYQKYTDYLIKEIRMHPFRLVPYWNVIRRNYRIFFIPEQLRKETHSAISFPFWSFFPSGLSWKIRKKPNPEFWSFICRFIFTANPMKNWREADFKTFFILIFMITAGISWKSVMKRRRRIPFYIATISFSSDGCPIMEAVLSFPRNMWRVIKGMLPYFSEIVSCPTYIRLMNSRRSCGISGRVKAESKFWKNS